MKLQSKMAVIGSQENSRYRWHEMQCAKEVAVAKVQVSSGVGLAVRMTVTQNKFMAIDGIRHSLRSTKTVITTAMRTFSTRVHHFEAASPASAHAQR